MRSPRWPTPLRPTESSGWNPLIARKIAGRRVRAGVGWVRCPFLLMVSRLESPDVMLPYLLGAILSRSMSFIRPCGALGALSSEVPATAGVSTVNPPGSGFELGQKTRPRCRECPSSPTRPLYVRPQSQGPKFWMEAPPNSGGLSGGPAYGGRTFRLRRVSDWGLRRLAASLMMCGVCDEVDLRPEPVTYYLIRL